ncbi:hypothetical protein DIURU_005311 [Diutina rugosa]|uniref:Vacuolar sorting protein Vps3844 C-terminal domain-containing protein n=1 Tax=Diutina rugosa TaxID=5481 RepID=A0A642UDY8_DIURU|nr:uncharacterized protein DIURU_005311 [Diutina rugosa]KAA8897334.1 hypothetical protein DIURU_005311 [Diutina rugosa]
MQLLLAVAAVLAPAVAKTAVFELARDGGSDASAAPVAAHVARAYLSDKFGASSVVALGDGALGDQALQFINAHHYPRASNQLVVSVSGVAAPESFAAAPLLVTSDDDVAQQVRRDLKATHSAHHLTEEITIYSDASDHPQSVVNHFSSFDSQLAAIWRQFVNDDHQQVLASDGSRSRVITDKLFMTELAQLLHLRRLPIADAGVVVMDVGSINSLANKLGHGAPTVEYARDIISQAISQFGDDYDVTVIVSDDDVTGADPVRFGKRSQQVADVFAQVEKRGKLGFDSEEKCKETTGDCSGHGKCVNFQDKWRCACEPSFDKEKQKTTKWAGADCSKKDVSSEANMFLWTGIVLLAFLVAGGKLMYSVGSQPLPGVLQAATNPKKTN